VFVLFVLFATSLDGPNSGGVPIGSFVLILKKEDTKNIIPS
jgi:hypothetical protein